VAPELVDALGLKAVHGRLWIPGDPGEAALVSTSFAEKCCRGALPLGLSVLVGPDAYTVVGVVKDMHFTALDKHPEPTVLLPAPKGSPISTSMNYVIRLRSLSPGLLSEIEREVSAAAADVTVRSGDTLRNRLMRTVDDRSFATLIVVLFSIAAVSVSFAGVAGVVGFVVTRRAREIAIRMALGATTGKIWWLVSRSTGTASACGVVAGFGLAWWLSSLVSALVYGIPPFDTASVVVAGVLICVLTGLGMWAPLHQANRVNPSIGLRRE
jgi:hypothetical protein